MLEAILTYNVRPEFIAQYFENGSFSYLLPWTLNEFIQAPLSCSAATFNNETYIASFDPEREKSMNQYRAKIGLCTLNELRKKIAFENKNQPNSNRKNKYNFNCGINGRANLKTTEQLSQWQKVYQYNTK
jgi:hypothetical protein